MTFQEYLATLRILGDAGPFTDPMGILAFAMTDYSIETQEGLLESIKTYVAPFRITEEIKKSVAQVWATYETACERESKRAIEQRKQRLQAMIG